MQHPPIQDAVLLSRLPFLPQARPLLEQLAERSGLDTMALIDGSGANEMGIRSRQRGMQRVLEAVLRVEADGLSDSLDLYTPLGQTIETMGYVYALMLVCASGEEALARRWAHGEALRATTLLSEQPAQLEIIAQTYLGDVNKHHDGTWEIPLPTWLESAVGISGQPWRLVNQHIVDGKVMLVSDGNRSSDGRLSRILLEVIRSSIIDIVQKRLANMDDVTHSHLAEAATSVENELRRNHQKSVVLTDTHPDDWPPCLASAIQQLSDGVNVNHVGRVFLAAMAATMGWTIEATQTLFANAPDYDADTTRYQLNSVFDRGYTPHGCDKLKLNHNCPVTPGQNSLCDREWLTHPLKYLKARQRYRNRDEATAYDSEQGRGDEGPTPSTPEGAPT